MMICRTIRADPLFIKELNEIKIKRLQEGRDSSFLSDRRITKAIRNLPDWPVIKNRIIQAEIKRDWKNVE